MVWLGSSLLAREDELPHVTGSPIYGSALTSSCLQLPFQSALAKVPIIAVLLASASLRDQRDSISVFEVHV